MEILKIRKYKNKIYEEKKNTKESNTWRRRLK